MLFEQLAVGLIISDPYRPISSSPPPSTRLNNPASTTVVVSKFDLSGDNGDDESDVIVLQSKTRMINGIVLTLDNPS